VPFVSLPPPVTALDTLHEMGSPDHLHLTEEALKHREVREEAHGHTATSSATEHSYWYLHVWAGDIAQQW
jgi:hypothetical protein